MKTILQALRDEIVYPLPLGLIENIAIKRGLSGEVSFTAEIASSKSYRGALADCLWSLVQSVNFSEADKSVGALTDAQRDALVRKANMYYRDLGEEEVSFSKEPAVYIIS